MAARCLSKAHYLRASLGPQQSTRLCCRGANQTRNITLSLVRDQTQTATGRNSLVQNPLPRCWNPSTSRLAAATAIASFTSSSSAAIAQTPAAKMEMDDDQKSNGSMADNDALPYSSMEGRLHPSLLSALKDMKYTHMSPVQEKVLDGKLLKNLNDDAIVQAKTGTGKTTAFLLPTLQTLIDARDTLPRGQVGVLILSPTRDLAIQIAKECNELTSQMNPAIECHLAYGGSNKSSNLNKFMNGKPSVLVATPGRLGDYLTDPAVRKRFNNLRALVLDEADTMLDSGFLQNLIQILKVLPPKSEAKWQGLLYSATMPPKMRDVTHLVVKPNCVTISTVSKDDVPTVNSIPQTVSVLRSIHDLYPAVQVLLKTEYEQDGGKFKAVVFTHTARNAHLLHDVFSQAGMLPDGLKVYQMQSRMSQPARDRTVREFKAATSGVMFASDVVGRGMDFPDVSLVVQIGLPQTSDQYVHRVGRTGRAGKSGRASMILLPEEASWAAKHPQYPMVPMDISTLGMSLDECRAGIGAAFQSVTETLKAQAYVAFLGYVKSNTKFILKDGAAMVRLANEFSRTMGQVEPPELERSTVGKMGLKGVPGLRIAASGAGRFGGGSDRQSGGSDQRRGQGQGQGGQRQRANYPY